MFICLLFCSIGVHLYLILIPLISFPISRFPKFPTKIQQKNQISKYFDENLHYSDFFCIFASNLINSIH